MTLVRKFDLLLNKEDKKQLPYIIFITLVSMLLEMLSISLVIPLVENIITGNNKLSLYSYLLVLIVLYIMKNVFIIYERKYKTNYVYNLRVKNQAKVLNNIINKPYEYFLSTSTSEVMRNVQSDVINAYSLLFTLINLASEILISIGIIVVVFTINPKMTLMLCALLVIIVLLLNFFIKPKIEKLGIEARQQASNSHKILLETIHGIKQIKVSLKQKIFVDNYEEAINIHSETMKKYRLYSSLPRQLIELGCILSMLITIAVMLMLGQTGNELLPTISGYALAAIKLIPCANRIVNASNEISFKKASLDNL